MGLGLYSYFSGSHQLKQQRAEILARKPYFGIVARQRGISGIAAVLVGMGVWRLVN